MDFWLLYRIMFMFKIKFEWGLTSHDLYVDFSAQQSSENTSKRKLGNQVSISLM